MEHETPAQQLDSQRAALEWARQLRALQPQILERAYEQAGREIAQALTQETPRISIQLPHMLHYNESLITVPAQLVALRVGSMVDVLRQRSSQAALLKALDNLTHHSLLTVSLITRFVSYLAGEYLLELIPSVQEIDQSEDLDRLSRSIAWMALIDQLYTGWAADDRYDEAYTHLLARLTIRGRAQADIETQQMIDELLAMWRADEALRGLTLKMPYLDEREYRMKIYRVVVIPTGRIPFQPEFVVGACRVEQQRVRKNPQFSQATRWQLISQLDSVIQAFENVLRRPSNEY